MKNKLIDLDEQFLQNRVENPFQTKQYLRLEQKWYEKLYESGFRDIEDSSKPSRPLRVWHNLKFKSTNITTRVNCEEYFNDAKELLNTFKFKNSTHRHIWALHCQGLSKRQIERAIANLPKSYKREQIGNIIKIIAAGIKI